MKYQLSKSSYMKGLQCEKYLWLAQRKPSNLAPVNAFDARQSKQGQAVGKLAYQLFPDGHEIPVDVRDNDKRVSLTLQSMNDNAIQTIFEATFVYSDVLVLTDILHKVDGGCELHEVKASSWKPGSKLSDIQNYIEDVAIQYYVLSGSGINISNAFVTMINSTYVREGQLDINDFFISIDVTKEVLELQASIADNIDKFTNVLSCNDKEPGVDIGIHCHKPNKCPAKQYCWQEQRSIPDYSVFNIFKLQNNSKSLKLYGDGIVNISDIPDNLKTTPIQNFYIDNWKNKANHFDYKKIDEFLNQISYPIFHLDFESFNPAIPLYKNSKPYQQIPFQYSIHIEQNNGALEHKEYLGDPLIDPREGLIKKLISDLKGGSTILVFSEGFEKTRIKEMADDFPRYKDELMSINDRVLDLAKVFSKRYYYLYKMQNQHSIKVVMPLLVPDMENKYVDLKKSNKVCNGTEAIVAFEGLLNEDDQSLIFKIRQDLIDYCELDTLSMVEVLKEVRNVNA